MMRLNRYVTLCLLAIVCVAGTFAENGSGKVAELQSPTLLGGGAIQGSMSAPHGLALNPASAATVQRLTFDGSYIGLLDSSDGFGPKGHAANISSMIPTKVGVFTGAGHFLTASDLDSFEPGTQISAYGAFSKDVYPDYFVGSGARFTFGNGGRFAAAADLGLIRRQGDYLFFEDLHWGLSLLDLGYTNIKGDRRAPFTPSAGFDGIFAQNDTVEASLKTDLTFLSFQNARLGLGLGIIIAESFEVGIGSRMDARQIADGTYGELIPSVRLSYTIRPGGKEKESDDASYFRSNEMRPTVFTAPLGDSIWATGAGVTMPVGILDEKPPEIRLDLSHYSEESEEEAEDRKSEQEGAETEEEDAEGEESENGDVGVNEVARPNKLAELGKRRKTPKLMRRVQESKGTEDKEQAGDTGADPGSGAGSTDASDSSDEDDTKEAEFQKTLPPEAFIYISPNNDGIKDSLEFPLEISDSRYLKEYEFVILDAQGNEVRTIENKEKRPEIRNIGTFFKNLFASKKGVSVPETLRWDGTTDAGRTADDALYRFFVRATDDNGNTSESDTYTVYVDTTQPKVEIEKRPREERIFSPNNDGNKDTLPIEQNGSVERLWKGRIENSSGSTVRTFTWRESKPESFEWDGTDDEEILVPDGVYAYKVEATDRAGNSGSAEYGNIVKNTEETPISLKINRSHFSPNSPEGDGRKDTVTIRPHVPVTTGIEEWSIEVLDEEGEVRRSYLGGKEAPDPVLFDGRSDLGERLEEGTYHARIEVLYVNGNNPKAESPEFVLDVTPPSASINANTDIFSPNGDGKKDSITFYQETSTEEVWHGEIVRENEEGEETVINEFKWIEKAPAQFTWSGRTDEGALAEDSDSYYYRLYAEDRAGNRLADRRGQIPQVRFELTTKDTPVFLSVDMEAFSPNNDGVKDEVHFTPRLEETEGIAEYAVTVYPAGEPGAQSSGTGGTGQAGSSPEPVRSFEGTGRVPEEITWNGRNADGDVVEDGDYRAEIFVAYEAGNEESSSAGPFTVDTVYPSITVEQEYRLFSPNGDGRKDNVEFMQSGSSEELWQGEINDADGNTVATAFWKGRPGDFSWDGTDDAGNVVEDGSYTYRVSAADRAGNSTEERAQPVTVDTRPTNIFVTADSDKLSPNGDGEYEEIAFSTIVNLTDGVESWSLELVDGTGTVQRSFEGEERIPKRIIWDGKSSDGEYVEGRYSARFTVEYRKGNRPVAESLPFVLDISPPEAEVNLSPVPFSPDNDGVDDELNIRLDVQDMSDIAQWSFTIYDPENREFKEFGGNGAPAEKIIWDGRSDDGELVYSAMDYPYRFSVSDTLGNRRTVRGEIPVDVLVVREGGVLKIKIANINFKPNLAEFVDDDPEIAQRNEFVLDRVAEILKKYRQYEVTIEGHAVITKWYDEELAEQEQEQELIPLSKDRAERVKRALTERGVPAGRLSTKGVGGSKPLVPHSDEENRWKNRRVEFILEKE